ncbi:MAG: hypothetical protein RL539_1512, partial [Pseudomonadota bacterium]
MDWLKKNINPLVIAENLVPKSKAKHMPLPPAPRKPATLIDLEAVAKQRTQGTRKKTNVDRPVAEAISHERIDDTPMTMPGGKASGTG